MKFSANLGFLWTDRPLPEAIKAASHAGFDAVECHWPYQTPAEEVVNALRSTGLDMLGLNTVRGDVEAGENGLSALPGREAEAKDAIDQAIEYAQAIATKNIHVMAGNAEGDAAKAVFMSNLQYAADQAEAHGITILIEPLNHYDAPGYFLNSSKQAAQIIQEIKAPNLKIMFDCYHLQIMEGNITRSLQTLLPIIGHIQIASIPDRSEPDHGELNYTHVMKTIAEIGYTAPIGAEYRPISTVEEGVSWLNSFRSINKI